MPTARPRHSITETPPVQDALDRPRARRDIAWLIRDRTYDPGEVAAADEVKRLGLIANYE